MDLHTHLKVLLVDDDPIANYLSQIVLKNCGITNVNVALNGMDAIAYLEKETVAPDIILLDLNMPIMGGLEFLQKNYENEICLEARIFILTSSIRPEDKLKSLVFDSVKDYLVKPLNEQNVKGVLSNF